MNVDLELYVELLQAEVKRLRRPRGVGGLIGKTGPAVSPEHWNAGMQTREGAVADEWHAPKNLVSEESGECSTAP